MRTTCTAHENGNIIALNQSVPNQAVLTYGDASGKDVSLKTEIGVGENWLVAH